MKKYFYVIILTTCLYSSNVIIAQNSSVDSAGKNVLYLEGSSILVYNTATLNYDRRIKQYEKGFFKHYYLNAGAGVFNLNSGFGPGSSANGILGGLNIIGLTGKKKGHFEVTLGFDINIETSVSDSDFGDEESYIIPDDIRLFISKI